MGTRTIRGRLRSALAVASSVVLTSFAFAGSAEKQVGSRWLGAWVVSTVEGKSDCTGGYTNNRINGRLVKSNGHYPFKRGELARVDSVDVKRGRVDLHLTLVEPILAPWNEGPFTLYNEVTCRLEYQVETAGNEAKRGDLDAADRVLGKIVQRFEDEDGARSSAAWNRRQREDYPADYETTLARHAAWKAEQTNLAVQARLDVAVEQTARVRDRVTDDPQYLAGFARGVASARTDGRAQGCPAMLGLDLASVAPRPSRATPSEEADLRGYADGRVFAYGIELIRGLPTCFVPVPEVPVASEQAQVSRPRYAR